MGNAGFIPSTVWIPSRAQGLGASGLESSEVGGVGGGGNYFGFLSGFHLGNFRVSTRDSRRSFVALGCRRDFLRGQDSFAGSTIGSLRALGLGVRIRGTLGICPFKPFKRAERSFKKGPSN